MMLFNQSGTFLAFSMWGTAASAKQTTLQINEPLFLTNVVWLCQVYCIEEGTEVRGNGVLSV